MSTATREASIEALNRVLTDKPPIDWVDLSFYGSLLSTIYGETFSPKCFGYSTLSLLFNNLKAFNVKIPQGKGYFIKYKDGMNIENVIFPLAPVPPPIEEPKPIAVENKRVWPLFPPDWEIATKLLNLKESAAKRKIKFDLSFKTVKKLVTARKCYYTGIIFDHTHQNSFSVDRVDASKGYIEGNVVACTTEINRKKDNLTSAEILLLAKKITTHTKKNTVKKSKVQKKKCAPKPIA